MFPAEYNNEYTADCIVHNAGYASTQHTPYARRMRPSKKGSSHSLLVNGHLHNIIFRKRNEERNKEKEEEAEAI